MKTMESANGITNKDRTDDDWVPNEDTSFKLVCFPRSMCRIIGKLDADGNLVELEAPKTK